jgi:N-acetylglutamate synthase-like GNAT family acetyltransferase
MNSIKKVMESHLKSVYELFKLVDLPIERVKENFSDFFVIQNEDQIIGCIGLEIYGEVGLLISLAVIPSHQGRRIDHFLNEIE